MKVVLDTDPGIDDAMALLYLQSRNTLDLLGITTILGNASIDQCTENALYLCERFGIHVPVYRGASVAINGSEPDSYPDFVHGKNGLGEVDVSVSKLTTESIDAAQYLSNICSQHIGEVTIIAIGRLTNLALAIQAGPDFGKNVKDIVIMGGAIHCPGNVTPWAEANIIGDPEAAEIVFASGIATTLVGLDVTTRTKMDHDYVDGLCLSCPEIGGFLKTITKVYSAYHLDVHGDESFPVHDSSAIAFADQAFLFQTQRGKLSCVVEGEQRGRTLFEPDSSGPHLICTDVNSPALLDRYKETLILGYGT